jgi:hypothetical protein
MPDLNEIILPADLLEEMLALSQPSRDVTGCRGTDRTRGMADPPRNREG